MNVNYSQAGRRHFDDCRTLSGKQRAGNSSHLAGLAAECALKAVLHGLGILTLDTKGVPDDPKHKKQRLDVMCVRRLREGRSVLDEGMKYPAEGDFRILMARGYSILGACSRS